MNGRLRLPGFGGDTDRVPDASVRDVEQSIRRRLYGERRSVRLVAPDPTRSQTPVSAATRPLRAAAWSRW